MPLVTLFRGQKHRRDREKKEENAADIDSSAKTPIENDTKVLKSLPLVAVLRKAHLARELLETQWFIFLILFMALSVYKFLGVSYTRIESNGFFLSCIEDGAGGGDFAGTLTFYGIDSATTWDCIKGCSSSMFERGIELSEGGDGIGSPVINDFQTVVMLAIIQTHRYITAPCNAGEYIAMDGQICLRLEGPTEKGTSYGPGDKFQRQFIPNLVYEDGVRTSYNGQMGVWVYVQYLSYGTHVNLTNSEAILQSLEDDGFVDRYTYKVHLDVIAYANGYHELNYNRITFTRAKNDGGLRSAGFIPSISSAPINPLIRSWDGYQHPLSSVDYDYAQRKQDGMVIEIVYGFFLLVTWYMTLRDAGASLVEQWIETFNSGVTNQEAIGSLVFVVDQRDNVDTSHWPWYRRLIRPFTRAFNYANVWRYLVGNHFSYPWNLIDLASNAVMTLNIIFLSIAVANGNKSDFFRNIPDDTTINPNTYLGGTNELRNYVTIIQYTAAVSMILAAVRIFRSLKDVPGLRVYSLLFFKAYPRLKDFFVFFIVMIFFLSISIWFVFTSSGGNPAFKTLGDSFASIFSFTFGQLSTDFFNANVGVANQNQIITAIFWLVIILLNVIALNILLAIIVDAYNFAEEDEALSKEAKAMLEPTFLTNYLSLMYFILSVPFDIVFFPFYYKFQTMQRTVQRKVIATTNKILPLGGSNPGQSTYSRDTIESKNGGPKGPHRPFGPAPSKQEGGGGLLDVLDRNGDNVITWEDRELEADVIDEATAQEFCAAIADYEFPNATIDLREIIEGFRLDETSFKLKGTNAAPTVLFLKRFLQAPEIDRWPDPGSRVPVYSPSFEGYGDSTVKVSKRCWTPGVRLFSIPSYFGLVKLPILLLEWKLARDPLMEHLLDFFEDATTASLDESVADMVLNEDQLLDYYLKAAKATAQEKMILDSILSVLFKTPTAFIFSVLGFELPLLICHGCVLDKIKEKFFGLFERKAKTEAKRRAKAESALHPDPENGLGLLHRLKSRRAQSRKTFLESSTVHVPDFSPDFDAVVVLTFLRDVLSVYGRPHALQSLMKEKIAKFVVQYAHWARIPLHTMDEAGGRPCGLLETTAMQRALNKVSWNVVTRMSKEDQEERNKMFAETGQEDDDEDTTLEDFVHMAIEEYLDEKGWPGGLGEREKNKIRMALESGALQLLAAIEEEKLNKNKSKSQFVSRATSDAREKAKGSKLALASLAGGGSGASATPSAAGQKEEVVEPSAQGNKAGAPRKKGSITFHDPNAPAPPQVEAAPVPSPAPVRSGLGAPAPAPPPAEGVAERVPSYGKPKLQPLDRPSGSNVGSQ